MRKNILWFTFLGWLIALGWVLGQQRSVVATELPEIGTPPNPVLPPDFEFPPISELREPDGQLADPKPIIYGMNFISSAEEPADAQRYANAAQLGARWDRFPLYWNHIELTADNFNYSTQDAAIIADIEQGYLINAILLGTSPAHYGANGMPNGLNDSIFTDGSDTPGEGKTINPNNKWARFVERTVNRYKPDGILTQQGHLNGTEGIRQWEMWNEPDLTIFWSGNKAEYARLLKVGYLVTKHADPQAEVIFGAVANNWSGDRFNYYKDVLTIFQADPLAESNHYFHDIFATHSYYNAWQTWYHVFRAQNTMGEFGLDKPVWLNETGMTVWNDYPGPVWASTSTYRGTMDEQADYIIQTAMYGLFAGADAVFHFQLQDGCGNQPQQTNFPPHNGELCTADGNYIHDTSKPCYVDANGLFRNATDSICASQHPQPETARPSLTAYQILTQYLQDVVPLRRMKVCSQLAAHDGQEWIAFYRPNTNQRIMGLWTCDGTDKAAVIPAVDTGALLLSPDGTQEFIAPTDGYYYLTLPAATNQNYPNSPNPNYWPVGGRPYILVERDLQLPTVMLNAAENSGTIDVNWSGDDQTGSGIQSYDILVSVDGGTPQPWLMATTQTSAQYTGDYIWGVRFIAIARDQGGNVSDPATFLIGEEREVLAHKLYLPVLWR
ncbi:MAG: hypothetical protein ACPG8W_12305 [Candidatus Promineifilaceae bacterium]